MKRLSKEKEMVLYYCEICNKNVDVLDSFIPQCTYCSNILIYSSLNQAEIARRNKVQTVYCSNCNILSYAISSQFLLKAFQRKADYINQSAINIRNKKARNVFLEKNNRLLGKDFATLTHLSKSFTFLCRNCLNGINIEKGKSTSAVQQTLASQICERCGAKNNESDNFCNECGNKLNLNL